MRTDSDVVGFGHSDGFEHEGRVAGVESAGYVCNTDIFDELIVGSLSCTWFAYLDSGQERYDLPPTKTFAHITVDLDLLDESCHC